MVSTANRRQRPRGSITRDAVVVAALAVVDRVGVKSLTIRAVARQVGAPPMSLYTHFSNKDELLNLMSAEVVRHLYTDASHPTWQDELRTLCRRIYSTLLDHPNWTPLLGRPAQPMDLPLRERLLAMMVSEGIEVQLAYSVISSAALCSMGLVIAELTLRDETGQSTLVRRFDALQRWSETDAAPPLTRAALAHRRPVDRGEVFEQTVGALVKGFEVVTREARIGS